MTSDPLFCLRIRYIETGRLRYLSHLELMRALERTIRRSGVPYAITQGYVPHIKAAFGPALPVGVASFDEWFDLWVCAYRPAAEYLRDLSHATPEDLAPQEAAYVDLHTPSLSSSLTISKWEIDVAPDEGNDLASSAEIGPATLEAAYDELCEAGEITYLRSGTPRTVSLEGKFAAHPVFTERQDGLAGAHITLTTRASNAGALRPDVLMGALLRQLTESSAAQGESGTVERSYGISNGTNGQGSGVSWTTATCKPRLSIVRVAQFVEGKDGSWARPI